MKQSNSNTSSENEISELPLRLISMSNGSLVIGRVTAMNQHVVQLNFPISLRSIYDSDGDIVGTSTAPYQMPFARLSPFVTVNFNINQVVSFAEPAPELIEQYEKILAKVTERFLAMASGAIKDMSEPPPVKKEEKAEKTEEDDIDVGMWKPYSTMIH